MGRIALQASIVLMSLSVVKIGGWHYIVMRRGSRKSHTTIDRNYADANKCSPLLGLSVNHITPYCAALK